MTGYLVKKANPPGATWIAWLMLFVWAALGASFQLIWAQRLIPFGGPVAWWMPDFCLVLLVALAVSIPVHQVWKAALVLAFVRIGLTQDPPAAVLSAYGWVALSIQALRAAVDVSGALPRTAIGFIAALFVSLWGQAVHYARFGASGSLSSLGETLDGQSGLEMLRHAFPGALIACVLIGFLGHFFARLPGLSLLHKVRRF